ncbi:MAG: DNA primase [Candidatus Omnitrophica bacterium]|nr:DNA primase [Candidatus Omnitrophota bacterium]
MIPEEFINEIQAKTDIVELIASYIPLKRMGRNFKTLCPFHNEKTPSFFVSPQKQIFHCFGCGEGGGVIQFVMLYEKVTFPEAVEILAKKLGLEIPYQKADKNKILLYEAVAEASNFFHKTLLENKEAKEALKYLSKRNIDMDIIKKFQIGYSLGKNTLLDYLRKKGFSIDTLEKASLVIPQKDGYRDLFCARIMFPIFDVRGRVLAFGARLLADDISGAPKYINSFEGPLYSKREHLFGLNFSKDDILKNDCVIVVEGYLDMITPFAYGIRNIVASLGTALTLEQIRLIKRYTLNVILLFDSDSAGQNATGRAIDLLLENELNVGIVTLPAGYDPDALIRSKGKEYFFKILEQKKDFFDYKLNILKNTHDIDSITGKTSIANSMLSTIYKLKSEIQRYEYVRKLADVLKIKEEVLIAEARKLNFNNLHSKESIESYSLNINQPLTFTEKIILKFMFTNKKALLIAKKNLREDDFSVPLVRKTVSYFFNTHFEDEFFSSPTKFLGLIQDKEISRLIVKILMEDIPLDKELFKSSILKLLKNRTKNFKEKLKEEIKSAEKTGDKSRLKFLIEQYDKVTSELKNE